MWTGVPSVVQASGHAMSCKRLPNQLPASERAALHLLQRVPLSWNSCNASLTHTEIFSQLSSLHWPLCFAHTHATLLQPKGNPNTSSAGSCRAFDQGLTDWVRMVQ